MNPQVINFFKELLFRIRTKSPRFFFILSVFGAALTFAGYVPTMLESWFNVALPDNIVTMCKDIAKYSTGFFIATLLPADSTPIAKTDEGEILKTTDENKLPFSSKSEKVSEAKKESLPEIKI